MENLQNNAILQHSEQTPFSYGLTEAQEKDLRINQLELDLENTKNDLNRLLKSTPELESLYQKLNQSNETNHNLECTISSLKTRIQQLQTNNSELKKQIILHEKNANNKIEKIQSQSSVQLAQLQEKFSSAQKEKNTLFNELKQITEMDFNSFNDIIMFIKNQYKNPFSIPQVKKLKEKNKALKNTIEDLNSNSKSNVLYDDLKNEKNKLQEDLDNVICENENLRNLLSKSKSVIEDLTRKNEKYEKKIENHNDVFIKIKTKNRKLKEELYQIRTKSAEFNDPRITQLQEFLKQKTNDIEDLNKRISSINMEKDNIERQYAILVQKNREFISFKEIIQKEMNNLKLSLKNSEDERNLLSSKISKLEEENMSLISKAQSSNQKYMLMTTKVQEAEAEIKKEKNSHEEYNEMIKVFEKIVESQKDDLSKTIQLRNILAEKLLRQTDIIAYEDTILSKQIEQNRILKAKLKNYEKNSNSSQNSNPEYIFIGFVKNLLLPLLSNNLQESLNKILDDSSLSTIQRLKQLFNKVGNEMNSTIHIFKQTGSPSTFSKIIVSIENLKNNYGWQIENEALERIAQIIGNNPEVNDLFSKLINTNSSQASEIANVKSQMKKYIDSIENIIKNFGCKDVKEIKNYFDNLSKRLKNSETKLKEYRDIAKALKTELQKKMNEAENLKDDFHFHHHDQSYMKQEIKQLKCNQKSLKQKNKDLKDECDLLKLRLQATLSELDSQKQKHINELAEQKEKYDHSINKMATDTTASFSVSQQMISDFQQKCDSIEKRHKEEIKSLNNKIAEISKVKDTIHDEYRKREDETEKTIQQLMKRLEDEQEKHLMVQKELSQLRVEKKVLELRSPK